MDMMKFLGTICYYRTYIENFKYHTSVLTPVVKAKTPGSEGGGLSQSQSNIFCILNVPPDVFELYTDA